MVGHRVPVERCVIAACVCLLLLAAVPGTGLYPATVAAALNWDRAASGGFGDTANAGVRCMALYRDRLYAGTYNPHGCQVWSFDGVAWTREVGQGPAGSSTSPGFGQAGNIDASSMVVYNSALYVGTRNQDSGCQVWSYDGANWVPEVGAGEAGSPTAPGFGSAQNNDVPCMAVYGGRLYAGTYNPLGCQVWSYDGADWARVAQGGFGDTDNFSAVSMAVFVSSLYVGTFNNDYTSGCQVWSYNGATWTQEVGQGPAGSSTGPGFGDSNNRKASSMAAYSSGLYVGTNDSSGGAGCQVWSFDGANWMRVGSDGFGNTQNLTAASMVANGLDLYVGTYNESYGCEVWSFDGTSWSKENSGGFGYKRNSTVNCMIMDAARLYAGTESTSTANGCEVWASDACQMLYFAEGYTGTGFHEYLSLANPRAEDARTAITYLFADGSTLTRLVVITAESRFTVDVNADVGEGKDVSVKLESERRIVAERPVYFAVNGLWSGGHDVMATPSTSRSWYFAEGYTGSGFEEWICVLNPGSTEAALIFRFQVQGRGEQTRTGYSVPPHCRRSFRVNDILGGNYESSLKLESDSPVVAERPMYFIYGGTDGTRHWDGGHCVMGSPQLGHIYYFAEGTTRDGFEEWITLQNPNPTAINVNATYQPGVGQGEAVDRSYRIPARERYTVFVPREVGGGKDVSVVLVSTALFLAERPLYFLYTAYGASWAGGHCVIGAKGAYTEWYLAEGYTESRFQTWLCLQNPGIDDASVAITYYTQEKGPLPQRTVTVPAGTRQTILVNDNAGPNYQLSFHLKSNRPLVVERPMYYSYGGKTQGGDDVIGYPEGGSQ